MVRNIMKHFGRMWRRGTDFTLPITLPLMLFILFYEVPVILWNADWSKVGNEVAALPNETLGATASFFGGITLAVLIGFTFFYALGVCVTVSRLIEDGYVEWK